MDKSIYTRVYSFVTEIRGCINFFYLSLVTASSVTSREVHVYLRLFG